MTNSHYIITINIGSVIKKSYAT